MLTKVMAEKESYISKLEKELNEIRTENERVKDQLIVYEMNNFGSSGIYGQQSGKLSSTGLA